MPLPEHLADIEDDFETGVADEPMLEAGDPGYEELRTKLLKAAKTPEEHEAVMERYPFSNPGRAAMAQAHSELDTVNAERNQALADATTPEDLDAAYESHPMKIPDTLEYRQEVEYREAVQDAITIEQLDAVYEKYGKPVPDRANKA